MVGTIPLIPSGDQVTASTQYTKKTSITQINVVCVCCVTLHIPKRGTAHLQVQVHDTRGTIYVDSPLLPLTLYCAEKG